MSDDRLSESRVLQFYEFFETLLLLVRHISVNVEQGRARSFSPYMPRSYDIEPPNHPLRTDASPFDFENRHGDSQS